MRVRQAPLAATAERHAAGGRGGDGKGKNAGLRIIEVVAINFELTQGTRQS